jgi:2'-5' RNA ligase
MAKERPKSPRARLFVALELPDEVRDGLAAWQRDEMRDGALRALAPETLHLTLVFLGYKPERKIEQIGETALEAARGTDPPQVLLLPDPVGRPKGRPRLYAIEAEADDVVALQARVSEALAAARLYRPEKRPFWPHLTAARVRRERGSKRGLSIVKEPPGRLPEELREPFFCRRVRLYRSFLRREGAEYVPMAELEL